MRFRQKFGFYGYGWLAFLCFYIFLACVSWRHNRLLLVIAITWIAWATLQTLQRLFVFWEVSPSGLLEHRIWSTWRIGWDEITRVAPRNPRRPHSLPIIVDCARTGPLALPGQIRANPADREGFLAALRRFAPHADFEL